MGELTAPCSDQTMLVLNGNPSEALIRMTNVVTSALQGFTDVLQSAFLQDIAMKWDQALGVMMTEEDMEVRT